VSILGRKTNYSDETIYREYMTYIFQVPLVGVRVKAGVATEDVPFVSIFVGM
jgi:hypothetical protein